MYQALYRKYRPRTFSDVKGQDHITITLKRQIMSGRLSHAYLFVGTRGTGKTTCAKVLSRAINCENPLDGDPCNVCSACVGIENGSILDVMEMDAASNNGVDDVRALRDEAIYSPATVSKRVYIIDEVHMLSNSAFNALLKILEEPPEHIVFILATTALNKVPATILSRCQRFSFKRLSQAAIVSQLNYIAESEELSLSEDAAEILASLADGSMRDALSLLDQCASDTVIGLDRVLDTIGLVGYKEIQSMFAAIASRDITMALDILNTAYDEGRDLSSLLGDISSIARDMLVFRISKRSPLLSRGYSREFLSSLTDDFSPERLYACLNVLREAMLTLSRGGNAKLTVEMCLMRMCDERLSDDSASLLARIAAMERGVQGARSVQKAQGTQETQGTQGKSFPMEMTADTPAANTTESYVPTPETSLPDSTVSDDTTTPATLSPVVTTFDSPVSATPASDTLVSDTLAYDTLTPDALTPDSSIPDTPPTSTESYDEIMGDTQSDIWEKIIGILKHDESIYSLLCDDAGTYAEITDSRITIRVGDTFKAGMLGSKAFSDPISAAVKSVMGRELNIKVEVSETPHIEEKKNNLDDLNKFDIVEFE